MGLKGISDFRNLCFIKTMRFYKNNLIWTTLSDKTMSDKSDEIFR